MENYLESGNHLYIYICLIGSVFINKISFYFYKIKRGSVNNRFCDLRSTYPRKDDFNLVRTCLVNFELQTL